MLNFRVLNEHFYLRLAFGMRNHSELEKVDTLATLNLVVELNSDEGTFRRRQTSP